MTDMVFRTLGLTKVYRTGAVEVQALRGVDLELPPGEMSVLLGPSGSGKSTLLNILGGLDSATSGRAWFRNLELTGLDDRGLIRYRREHVGFVFQFYNLVPSLTARENVALVTEIAPYAETFLAPTLAPGDVVIMDNLPAHKVSGARAAIERVGARPTFLPPYSPGFNPIEQVFAKIKALLRRPAARTAEALKSTIAATLDAFTPHECANYFTNSGYEPD